MPDNVTPKPTKEDLLIVAQEAQVRADGRDAGKVIIRVIKGEIRVKKVSSR